MTNAVLIKRLDALEREVRTIKSQLTKRTLESPTKKLPRGLQIALREAEAGKLSGPFNTVEDFMAHLNR